MPNISKLTIVAISALVVQAMPAQAVSCSVPGSHSTIQEAIEDEDCTGIDLSSQTYSESIQIRRSLVITGQGSSSSIIEGLVEVIDQGTDLTLQNLKVQNGCQPEALISSSGASVQGVDLSVLRDAQLPCPPVVVPASIFSDGFESGDLSNWSSVVP